MKKRKLNLTIEMDSEDEAQNFISWIQQHSNVIDSRILPETNHLKNDKHFKKLKAESKKAKENLYNFINKHR